MFAYVGATDVSKFIMTMKVLAPGTLAWIQSDSAFRLAAVQRGAHWPVGSGSSIR